ncbi:MAG: hypothetical protein ABS939_06360 [Psychrobacillus sp.]
MKKIVSIILGLLVLLGIGSNAIYASGMTPVPLSKWYGQLLTKESDRNNVLSEVEKTFEEVNTFIMESLGNYHHTLQKTIENQIKESKDGIENHQQEVETQLNQSVNELKKENLSDYVDSKKIEDEIDQDIQEALYEVFGN